MTKAPRSTPTDTIHAEWWDAGEEVTIKTYLSGYDRFQFRAFMRKARADAEEHGADKELLDYEIALALMTFGIVSTTLTFNDGSPVNPTLDDYKRLDERDVEYVVTAISERLDLWTRAPAPATKEEADAARFRPGPALSEGPAGKAHRRRNAARAL